MPLHDLDPDFNPDFYFLQLCGNMIYYSLYMHASIKRNAAFIPYAVILALSLFSSYDAYAAYFKLKNPPSEVKLYTYQDKGRYFDTDYTKKNPPENDAGYDKRSNGLIELSAWAGSWIRTSEASIRGIDYRDFEIKADLPEGSKIKCSIDVEFEYGGYVNTASSGSARGYFLIQMDMGFLTTRNLEAWNHPAIGKTVYKKSNFKTWFEKVIDLTNQAAGDQLQDIATAPVGEIFGPAGEAAMLVVNAIQQLCAYGEDALEADLVTSGELGGTYQNLWLTINTQYRTFLTLQLCAQAQAPSQSITDNFSYICFYDQSPVKGIDFRSALPRKGFGITKVQLSGYDKDNVAIPDTYACPVIDIKKFGPVKTDPKNLVASVNKPEIFEVIFTNNGKVGSPQCKVHVESTNPPTSWDINIPQIDKGGTYRHEFEHKFNEYGEAVFTLTIDPDKVLDKYVDLTKVRKYTFNLTPKYDMIFIKPVTIERLDKEEGFQTNKPVIVKGKIKNDGVFPCHAGKINIKGQYSGLKRDNTEIKDLGPQEAQEFYFEFVPEGKKYMLMIEPSPEDQESDKTNNKYDIDLGDIEESRVEWRVNKEDVKITPAICELNKPVRFDLAITNNGNALGEEARGTVYVEGGGQREELMKFEFINVPAGGKAPIDNLTWTPKKKRQYSLCVAFDKDATKAKTVKRINFRQTLKMADVKEPERLPDTEIVESSIRYDEENERIYFVVRNHGAGYANVKAELYRVYGDNTTLDMRTNSMERSVSPNNQAEMWLYAPSGNFRYKVVVTTKSARNQVVSTKDFYYACREFTPDKIGPNLEIVGVILARGKYMGDVPIGQYFDPKVSYMENNAPVFINFTFIMANTGNVPCELPDCEGVIINKKYNVGLPEYRKYENTDKYKYSYQLDFPHGYKWIIQFVFGGPWFQPSRIIGFTAQRHRQALKLYNSADSDELLKGTIEPTETRSMMWARRVGAYFNCVAFFYGDYIMKFTLDTDDLIKDDAAPQDSGVIMEYSIADLCNKIRENTVYVFLLKPGISERRIKEFKDYHDEERARLKTTPEIIIIPPEEAASYGIRRDKVSIEK